MSAERPRTLFDKIWDAHVVETLPDGTALAERAVKIGSAGKIFGVTGWKVGWLVAAPRVAAIIGRAHQFLTFTTPPIAPRRPACTARPGARSARGRRRPG